MNENPPFEIREQRTQYSTIVVGLFLSIVLVAPLFVTPRPSFVTGHPWKVEMLASIFLLLLLARNYFRRQDLASQPFYTTNPHFSRLVLFISGFVVISGLSTFWAEFPGSVAHHTLVWAAYFAFLFYFVKTNSTGIIFYTLGLTALVVSVLCFIDYATVTDFRASEGTLRIRYAKYAELLLTIAPLFWALAFYARTLKRSLVPLTIGTAGWIIVMLSLSKGAFIAGVAAFLLLFCSVLLLSGRTYRKRVVAIASLWLLVTVGTQVFFSMATSLPSTSDYISGKADASRSTSEMRVFTWQISGRMIASNWLIGVGADNFGQAFNRSRKESAGQLADADHSEIAEDYLVERAHNEFLQIAAELGVFGIVTFGGIFGSFAFWTIISLRSRKWKASPIFWGCFAGMSGFFVSSLFSSFSFRAMQNGIAFFLVFSIAINELLKTRKGRNAEKPPLFGSVPIVFRGAVAFTALLAIFSISKGISYYYVTKSQYAVSVAEAEDSFEKAITFDPENGAAYLGYAMLRSSQSDPEGASRLMRRAIEIGLGVTPTYSILARLQFESGEADASEKTMSEAVAIFPRSVFARVRYAVFLEKNAKPIEAARQLEIAETIDSRQAHGWYSIIKDGSVAAHFKAQADPGSAAPVELLPQAAVLQFMDESGPSARGNKKR